jgi:lysophospholipase L1-like esterase
VEKFDKNTIVNNLATLVNAIKQKNPHAKIAYSAIIFRPHDIPSQMAELEEIYRLKENPLPRNVPDATEQQETPDEAKLPELKLTTQQTYNALHEMEKKRRQINKALRKYCDRNDIFFLQSWKAMQCDDKTVNLNLFAKDGLHLNEAGIDAFKCYIQGNVATLIDEHKLTRGLKGAKPCTHAY